MGVSIPVLSISRPIWEQLQRGPLPATVLAVFAEACDLVTADDCVVALVLPQVGNGPLNVVVAGTSAVLSRIEVGMPARLDEAQLRVGGSVFNLEKARIWDPRPAWEQLRNSQNAFSSQWVRLRDVAVPLAPAGSLLALIAPTNPGGVGCGMGMSSGCVEDPVWAAMRRGTMHLHSGWAGDAVELRSAAAQLAGLGSGLTPAGDDFLIGVMLRAWLAHPSPRSLCSQIVEVAAPRTTLLSAAFLRAAARGECSEAWHILLTALVRGAHQPMAEAVQGILSHGATSGADALAGFLWAIEHAPL
jgi:hypothetical protein